MKETDAYPQGAHQSWCICSDGSVPDPYAQQTHKFMMCILLLSMFWRDCALCTHQYLTRMLSTRNSSWHVCSAYASVPDAHAQCMQQSLTRMLRVHRMNIWKVGKLMRMLSMRLSIWCVWCASVPDAHAQGAHQFLSRMLAQCRSMPVRNSKFSVIFEVPKTAKTLKKSLLAVPNGIKRFPKFFFA